MQYVAYSVLRDKVLADLGLEQETFITPSELIGYCNEGIAEAEQEVHTLYEDYYLTKVLINIVNGQSDYTLPTNMYADKIRALIYKRGTTVTTVTRYRNTARFEDMELDNITGPVGDVFKYTLINDSASGGMVLRIFPTPNQDITSGLILWYLRAANKIAAVTDLCDIPQFSNFVMQYMKVRCYEKEGNPAFDSATARLEMLRKTMINTLSNKVPDDDDTIIKDMSFYWEHN